VRKREKRERKGGRNGKREREKEREREKLCLYTQELLRCYYMKMAQTLKIKHHELSIY